MSEGSSAQCLAWGKPCSVLVRSSYPFCARDYLRALLRVTLSNALNKIQMSASEADFIEPFVKIFLSEIYDIVINMLLR